MIDYSNFESTLKNLERHYGACQEHAEHLDNNTDIKELVQMGLIQSFEVCYSTALFILRLHLEKEMGVDILSRSAPAIFKAAHSNHLISDPDNRWGQYVKARNVSSHEYYTPEDLSEALKLIPDFCADAVKLYEAMSKKQWERPRPSQQ